MVVPVLALFKARAFRGHNEGAFFLRVAAVRVAFRDREQAVEGVFQEAGDEPVIERRGQYDDVRFFIERVDLFHVVPLHAGMVRIFSASPAAEAAVDLHPGELKFRHFVAGCFCTAFEFCRQGGCVAFRPRASVQDNDILCHVVLPFVY